MPSETPGNTKSGEYEFSAPLYRLGVNRCVDVPKRVSRALGGQTRIGVVGSVEGIEFRSTLVPRGNQRHRLFVHSRIWRPLGLDVGDAVAVTVARDPQAAAAAVPPWLDAAFDRRPTARRRFETLGAPTRREMISWLEAAKRRETRERRFETLLDRLEGGRLRID